VWFNSWTATRYDDDGDYDYDDNDDDDDTASQIKTAVLCE
jgi:hypothetical protein